MISALWFFAGAVSTIVLLAILFRMPNTRRALRAGIISPVLEEAVKLEKKGMRPDVAIETAIYDWLGVPTSERT